MSATDPTIGESLTGFRRANDLDVNEDRRIVWMAQLGSYIFPLPNFIWRREIINRHDAHHMLTGYPTTASGELSLASWELGARCYRDARAVALCGFLAGLGLLCQPRLTIRAFKKGRLCGATYASMIDRDFFDLNLETAKAVLIANRP